MKYKNLKVEMARAGLNQRMLAEKAGMKKDTFNRKITGGSDWTLPECLKIRNILNPELKLEYLFADGDVDE